MSITSNNNIEICKINHIYYFHFVQLKEFIDQSIKFYKKLLVKESKTKNIIFKILNKAKFNISHINNQTEINEVPLKITIENIIHENNSYISQLSLTKLYFYTQQSFLKTNTQLNKNAFEKLLKKGENSDINEIIEFRVNKKESLNNSENTHQSIFQIKNKHDNHLKTEKKIIQSKSLSNIHKFKSLFDNKRALRRSKSILEIKKNTNEILNYFTNDKEIEFIFEDTKNGKINKKFL